MFASITEVTETVRHVHVYVSLNEKSVLGASFLIPYVIMLVVVGLPAMLVELSVGQYARVGANKVFGRMVPAFKVSPHLANSTQDTILTILRPKARIPKPSK